MWYKLTTSGHCYLFIEAIPTEFQFTISFRYRHKEKLNEKKNSPQEMSHLHLISYPKFIHK